MDYQQDSIKEQIGLSIIGYSTRGLIPIISSKLPFLDSSSSLDTFLYRFSTPIGMLLGQGDQYCTGLYGPYPIPNYNFHAYSFSFFLADTILGTPRNDLNAFLIALIFIPKFITLDLAINEDFLNNYVKSFSNLNDLLSKANFDLLIDSLRVNIFSNTSSTTTKVSKDNFVHVVGSPDHSKAKITQDIANEDENPANPVFIELKTEPESIIAIPWILHAVYHGLEHATFDILGENSSLLEILMEQYTAEILDRFHLFDSIFVKNHPSVKDAIDLGVKHLERVGEYVTVTPISDNKFECSINCSFANAVHPYLPITKCLWMRYLSAMIRRTLPPDKDLHISTSEFDPDFGSKTIIEVVPKVFKTI